MSDRHYYRLNKYLTLYDKVDRNHPAIGAGSSFHLYSKDAVKNFIRLNTKSRIIIMVRNPVEMAYLWHTH